MKVINIPKQDFIPVQGAARVTTQSLMDKNQVSVPQENPLSSDEENVSRKELTKAVEKMQRAVGIFDKHFKFSIHDKTHRVMVQIIDSRTNEVINEIPPKKILDMVADLQNMLGIFIDKKA